MNLPYIFVDIKGGDKMTYFVLSFPWIAVLYIPLPVHFSDSAQLQRTD